MLCSQDFMTFTLLYIMRELTTMKGLGLILSIEEIYGKYYIRVYHYIYGKLGHRENAMDVTADVFAAIWRNLSKFDAGRATLDTWIYAIARHAVLNFIKRESYRSESLGDVPDIPAPNREAGEKLDNLTDARLEHIFASLTVDERTLLAMRYDENLSNAEVGKALGLSESAVKQRYYRLLLKCRRIYDEKNFSV